MIIFFGYVFGVLAAIIEATLMPLPLTLFVVIFFFLLEKKPWVFLLAILSGILLDSLTFHSLGESSLFFLGILGVLMLYGRKFETNHMAFGISFTLLASFVFLMLFGINQLFFTLGGMLVVAVAVFSVRSLVLQLFSRRRAV